ncbi:MAG: DinB family protein [Bacteroidota bacterium]
MSSTRLDQIVHDLESCFDGRPWYGDSVMKKLNGVPWQKVNETVYGEKSIAVLVQHIINWRVFVLKKLQGDVEYDLIIDGPNDWSPIHIADQKGWEDLLNRLRGTQHSILELLSKNTDALLDKNVPGKAYTFGDVLPSLTQHDIYHLGQIAMLNTL